MPHMRAGFIGLGNIGQPMALQLLKAGLETTVYDISAIAVDVLVAAGAKGSSSPAELARNSDIIGVCVRNDDEVREVVTGVNGILEGATPGTILAVHSPVLPAPIMELAEAATSTGVSLIDACMTGGRMGAEAGTLTYMVGGDKDVLEKARPMLEAAASSIVHTGALGTGATVKLCNNVMTYLEFLAASEAFRLAEAAGLPIETLEEITRSNGNLTDQMQAFLGLHKLDAQTRQNLSDMLEGLAAVADKALASALELAEGLDLDLPGAQTCRQLMRRTYGLDD